MAARDALLSTLFLGCFLAIAHADVYHDFGVYLAQHDYVSMPVDLSGTNDEIIKAVVNGKKVSLVVDTGFGRTSITARCARRLKLDVHDLGIQENGVGGEIKGDAGLALISSFTLNGYAINRLNTIVVLSRSAVSRDSDGYLGFDYLHLNAAIMIVGAPLFLFKPGVHSPPPLDRFLGQLGFKAIPLRYGPGGLRVDCEMNGLPFTAVVDSGAEFSLFDFDFVRQSKGTNMAPLPGTGQGVDGRRYTLYGFTPKQLSVGPLNIKPVEITSSQVPYFAKNDIKGLLGYDLLGEHKAIIDLGHDILWMK